MLDNSKVPNQLEDTQVDVNPYEITDKIWALLEGYFEQKYNAELTELFPSKPVTRPTIVCNIVRRTPGREGSRIHGKGHNFVKFLKKDINGYIHELHVQQQEVIIEYSVFSPSTAEVKKLAWDLERAVLETVGILQQTIEGFQMYFEQQIVDSSMLWRQQDELVRRTIRFKALIPVKFTKLVPELRFIDLNQYWGSFPFRNETFVRDSSSKTYYVTPSSGQVVSNIDCVFVKDTAYPYEWIPLVYNTDYVVKKDSSQIAYIEWNDDFGRVPSVGETFRIDYDVMQLVKSSSIKP